MGLLTRLKALILANNQLTGDIPASFRQLANLELLWLQENQLTGNIPETLGGLSHLRELLLDNNRLTGPIPQELENFGKSAQTSILLLLHQNRLTGCIPKALADKPRLQFRSDDLTVCSEDDLPFPEGPCANGVAVPNPQDNPDLVQDCNLIWAVRDTLAGTSTLNWIADRSIFEWQGVGVGGEPARIVDLRLVENGLTGQIPKELGELTELVSLRLLANRLTGKIPSELGRLTNLERLSLSDNQLTGEIPVELADLTNLRILWLFHNRLTGEIPTELGDLPKLKELELSHNRLTGEIPATLGRLSNLGWLFLHNNQLTGEIPTELGQLTNLKRLGLSDNQLTGEIPTILAALPNLEGLILNNNRLTGEIPANLSELENLEDLFLQGNGLTGCIPKALADKRGLRLYTDDDMEVCPEDDLPLSEGPCANGIVVPDPQNNPGLVMDCSVLLGVLDTLANGASLNWSADVRIDRWERIKIGGFPGRVTELRLSGFGTIPPELGNLTELRIPPQPCAYSTPSPAAYRRN